MTLNQKLRASAQNRYTGQGKSRETTPPPITVTFGRIEHATLAYIIRGHSRIIKNRHAANFGRFGFVFMPIGAWYIPKTLLDGNGKLIDTEAREYAKRWCGVGRGM